MRVHSNLPGLEGVSWDVEKISAGESLTIQMPYCLADAEDRYIKGYMWFEENDPDYDPLPSESNPVEIVVPTGRLHVDGKVNGKDEEIIRKGTEVNFSLDLSSLDLSGCSSSGIIWDMGDGTPPSTGVTDLSHTFNAGGTYYPTVQVRCDDREEMDRIPVHVVDMRIDINGTDAENDDMVMLKSSLPGHIPVQGVEIIPANIVLSRPLDKTVHVKIGQDSGNRLGFPGENEKEKVITIPAGEITAGFSIAGYVGST
ncbi:MAG: hypothetical protein GXP46_00615, partial [Deferribacteres bacterium]|nr:hypothetical protein [Deferribacteres bacterium]